jgi:hypothetical protein
VVEVTAMPSSLHKLLRMQVRPLLWLVAPAAWLAVTSCGDGELVLPPVDQPRPQIEAIEGNGQHAPVGEKLGEPIVVQVLDEAGVGVPNGSVNWVVSAGDGNVTPTTSRTDVNGIASAEWTMGPTPGPNRVDAIVPLTDTATFTATADPSDDGGGEGGDDGSGGGGDNGGSGSGGGGSGGGGTGGGGGSTVVPDAGLSSVVASPAAIVANGGSSTITVTVRNSAGERVSGATVLLSVSGGGSTLTQPTGPTDVDGTVTGTLRSSEPGTKVVTAIVNGTVRISETAQVSVSAPVHHLEYLVQPHDVREGEYFTVKVALVDAEGRVVPLSGIEIYVDLFRAGADHPDNTRALGDRFRDTVNGIATFELRVINGSGGGPAGTSESGYRLRALTDELPEFGQAGPRPFLFSNPFDVSA